MKDNGRETLRRRINEASGMWTGKTGKNSMLKTQHLVFAKEVAKGSATPDAYLAAYPNCKSRDAAGAAGRRLKKLPEIVEAIQEAKTELVTLHEQSVRDAVQKAGGTALTWAMKRRILHDIANGKKTKIGTKGGKPVYKVPTAQDQIRAIELDNEMTGEGFRPPEPPPGSGTTINGPVYNTVIRKTVFKTRETTARGQTFQTIQDGED